MIVNNSVKLLKLDDFTYINVDEIVFLQLLYMSDKLVIGFKGGAVNTFANGRRVLNQIQPYIYSIETES